MYISVDVYVSKILMYNSIHVHTFRRKMLSIWNVLMERVYALTWHVPHQRVNCRKIPSSARERVNFFNKNFKQGARCSPSQKRLQPTPPHHLPPFTFDHPPCALTPPLTNPSCFCRTRWSQ